MLSNGGAGGMSFAMRPPSQSHLQPLQNGGMGGGAGNSPARQAPSPQQQQRSTSSVGLMGRTGNLQSAGGAGGVNEADNIKVAIRVRPLFPKDKEAGASSVLTVSEDHTTLKVVVGGPAGTTMARDFHFHACLGPEVAQHDVLHLCGVPQLLEAALSGYNVTIFAYGQTGSGKTFTMSGREEVIKQEDYDGDPANDGIVTRSCAHLFEAIARKRGEAKYTLTASYLEIYNEQICDLLNLKQKNMPVKWEASQGFTVPNLKTVVCTDLQKMHEVLHCGTKHRHVGSHELNQESSRSHSILTIHCSSMPLDTVNEGPRQGKISFVDLAGSERLKDSKSDGSMLKETANINKSLFVLGKVISALADKESSGVQAHIPYRDSKLTKLLMDSLGGSALALMIACCSPSSNHVEETLSTLTYATRAKNIQNRPTIQYDPQEAQILALRREIDLLRQENSYLRDQVQTGARQPPSRQNEGGDQRRSSITDSPPVSTSYDGSRGGNSIMDLAAATAATAAAVARRSFVAPVLNGSPYDGGDMYPYQEDYSHGGAPPGSSGGLQPPTYQRQSTISFSAGSARSSTNLEPLRASMAEVYDGGAFSEKVPPGGGRVLSAVGQPDTSNDLLKRLKDTQSLLSRFSEENGRLAFENDKLRSTRQVLSSEHADVLDEIDALRGKLDMLQTSVVAGVQTPNGARNMLESFRTGSSGGAAHVGSPVPTPSHVVRPPPSASSLNAVLNALNAIPSTRPPVMAGGGQPTYRSSSMLSSSHSSGAPALGIPVTPGDMAQQQLQQLVARQILVPEDSSGSAAAYSPTAREVLAAIPSSSPDGRQSEHGAWPSLTPPSASPMDEEGGGTISMAAQFSALLRGPPAEAPQAHTPTAGGGGSISGGQFRSNQRAPSHDGAHNGGGGVPIANVMAIGAGGSAAMRTRGNGRSGGTTPSSGYGASSGTPKGGDDSIIVADRAKLSMLLGFGIAVRVDPCAGFGSSDEPHPLLRPVPIKPPADQIQYANPLKQKHQHEIQRHQGIDD